MASDFGRPSNIALSSLLSLSYCHGVSRVVLLVPDSDSGRPDSDLDLPDSDLPVRVTLSRTVSDAAAGAGGGTVRTSKQCSTVTVPGQNLKLKAL
jgi:hypothetical protein